MAKPWYLPSEMKERSGQAAVQVATLAAADELKKKRLLAAVQQKGPR